MLRFLSRAAVVCTLTCAAAAAQAQTVDEIVARNLQAKGGAEKWKTVQSVKTTGTVTVQGPMGTMTLPLIVYAKRPNFMRQEVTIQGRSVVTAFDGNAGWLVNPTMGSDAPVPMPAGQAAMMKNTADFDGALLDYKSKGHTIELVGTEKLGEKAVYHLKVTMKGGQVQHYYLDTETGIEVKTSTEADVMGTGAKQAVETEMSDFQQVNGILIPHMVKQLLGGKTMVEMKVDKVEFNPPMEDALFKMPGK